MKLVKKYPILASSINSESIALTVKGILIGLIPVIMLVAGAFGLSLDMTELNTLADAIQSAILTIGSAISACMIVYGIIRKIIIRLKK